MRVHHRACQCSPAAYAPLFRTADAASESRQARSIAFAKLISEATNEDFEAKIGEFIDTDSLLRDVAANSLTSNLTGMSSVGANDYMCLDADGRFHIVASQMETPLGGSCGAQYGGSTIPVICSSRQIRFCPSYPRQPKSYPCWIDTAIKGWFRRRGLRLKR